MINSRYRGSSDHRRKPLNQRPLGKVRFAEITRQEVDTAIKLLRAAYDARPLEDPDGRPAAHRDEWQKQCRAHGLDQPGKFREICHAAKSRGVKFGYEGRVYGVGISAAHASVAAPKKGPAEQPTDSQSVDREHK